MDDQRRSRSDDDADIDLDTQGLVPPASEEPLGYGPGEWASGPLEPREAGEQPRPASAELEVERRLRSAEAAIETVRAATSGLEREVALLRVDLERLRQESEKAAGSKLP